MAAPSILIVDDGELDRVQSLVARLARDWIRCAEPEAGHALDKPRDLLITSGPRTMRLPPLEGDAEPTWVCIYDQDFLPLRERLRDLGVHYLVSSDLSPRAFALFLQQLLYPGEERRQMGRIPLHCELEVEIGGRRGKGLLLELSRESCVFKVDALPARDAHARLRLSTVITDGAPLDLQGRVIQAAPRGGADGESDAVVVVRFDAFDADVSARVHDILTGQTLGTQVTPLFDGFADKTAPAGPDDAADWSIGDGAAAAWEDHGERRREFRRHYGRRIDAIRWLGDTGLETVLGRDLSATGVRVAAATLPEVGREVTLALYGRGREEPLLLGATVVWCRDGEVGLHFGSPSADQQRGLQRLLADSPCVEELGVAPGA